MARWKRAAALAIVTGAAAISAGAASGWTASADSASRHAIEASLAAQGIDPATVVWQEGRLNYAGPNCPGPNWNCTTARRVVQFAQTAAQNVAECGPGGTATSTPTSDTCVIMQMNPGGTNHARCTLNSSSEPLAEQLCDITQSGARNTAHVDMDITQSTGPEQEARQRAVVDQAATERNEVHVMQAVRQRTSLGPDQDQNAFQAAEIQQTATGSDNFSHVHQSQDQDGSGAAATQEQNTQPLPEYDCSGDKPENPNQCADVNQDIESLAGGKNESHLHQAIGERQSTKFGTPAMPAEQRQGTLDNGQEGDVDQQNPEDVGNNHDSAHQDLRQSQSAPKGGALQEQLTDPNCCGFSQIGGSHNLEDIKQSVTQSATEGDDAVQVAELQGRAVQESAPSEAVATFAASSTTDGKCSVSHHGRNNSGADHVKVMLSPCPFLEVFTVCANEAGAQEIEGTEGCETTTDTGGGEGLTVPTFASFPTTPTFGLPIEMPSFGEPPDFPTVPFGP